MRVGVFNQIIKGSGGAWRSHAPPLICYAPFAPTPGARYTCSGANCGGPVVASREGPLYITLSNQPASGGSVYSGTVKFEFTPPYSYINPDARRSLQTLWNTCCKPWNFVQAQPIRCSSAVRPRSERPPEKHLPKYLCWPLACNSVTIEQKHNLYRSTFLHRLEFRRRGFSFALHLVQAHIF